MASNVLGQKSRIYGTSRATTSRSHKDISWILLLKIHYVPPPPQHMAMRVPRCHNPKGRQKEKHRKIRKSQVINLIYGNIGDIGADQSRDSLITKESCSLYYFYLVCICKIRREYYERRAIRSYERKVLERSKCIYILISREWEKV